MLYNYFTGTGTAADLAWMIVRAAQTTFGKVGNVTNLVNNLATKLRILYNSVGGGSFKWADLGGVILDIADLLATFIPAASAYNAARFLWTIANPL